MSLVEDAKAARKANMTYGQYMATKPYKPRFIPEKRFCLWCGVELFDQKDQFCNCFCRKNHREAQRLKEAKGKNG